MFLLEYPPWCSRDITQVDYEEQKDRSDALELRDVAGESPCRIMKDYEGTAHRLDGRSSDDFLFLFLEKLSGPVI